MDLFTRYVAAIPLKSQAAKDISLTFVNGWIFKHGVPETVLSDNGVQFRGNIARLTAEILVMKQLFKSTYHSQTNGMLERFHRYLKKRLVTLVVDKNLDLDNGDALNIFLPAIVSSYNITPNRMTKTSPHELVYGTVFVLPADIKLGQLESKSAEKQDMHTFKKILKGQLRNLRDNAKKAQMLYDMRRKKFENKNQHQHSFEIGDKVLDLGDQRTGNK
ncbi:hypothetical protein RFI_33993, partial [Reticulomyxa filosa]